MKRVTYEELPPELVKSIRACVTMIRNEFKDQEFKNDRAEKIATCARIAEVIGTFSASVLKSIHRDANTPDFLELAVIPAMRRQIEGGEE